MNIRILLGAVVVVLSACATPQAPMYDVAPGMVLSAPPADMAQVIFIAPKNMTAAISGATIHDIGANGRTMLAVMGSQQQSIQLVKPGHHVFMTNLFKHSHIMEANVEAGKRYYVVLRQLYGQGYQLRPARVNGPLEFSPTGPKFANWVSGSPFIEQKRDTAEWSALNKSHLDEQYAIAWGVWQKKSPEQRAELTLNASDAIAQ
jgi:hypothetical protein